MKSALLLLLGCLALQQGSAFVPNAHTTAGTVGHASSTSRLFSAPEPLAQQGEWTAYLDEETTGLVYYFNTRTGESLWEPPTDSFPSVYLKPSRRRAAEEKKAEYYKTVQQKEEKKGFLSKLLSKEQEAEEKLQKEQEPEWMQGILEEKYPEEEEKKPGLFSRLLKSTVAAAPEETTAAAPEPAPVPVEEPKAETAVPPKKGFLDNLFESMTADAVAETAENSEQKAARIAEEKRIAAENKANAAANADADRKSKEEARKKAEEAKIREQQEEEAIMLERVRKAEADQKAEADRAEADAKKAAVEAKKAEIAETKRAAAEAKKEAAAAKKAEQEAKKAEQAAKKAALAEEIIVEEKTTPIKIDIGSNVLPHPSKVLWGGEDAVFTKGRTFGVFDGVSGADKLDGLPLYSKMLARQMTQLVGSGNDLTIKDLQDQLLTAAEIADERATGASTAVVASITEDGFLRAINLGDSYCVVIRGEKVVAKTKEIVHYFDCPYQLSEISPDRPRDARKLNFELLRGDVVLMGSDGVFDNLEDSELVEIVNSGPGKASAIAKKVSDRSRKVSLNSNVPTPYSKQAKRNGDPDFRDGLGGKVDDVSCVVVRYD